MNFKIVFFFFSALVSFACAKFVEKVVVEQTEKPIPVVVDILESGQQQHADGSYSFHFRGQDGSFRQETAVVKNPGTEDEYLEIKGAYSYFNADGKEVVVNYMADNHGFVPEGDTISQVISGAAKQNSQFDEMEAHKYGKNSATDDDDE